jgi:hypothetical protein
MPYILKGIDAVVFSTFLSLGLQVIARPVLKFDILEADAVEPGFEAYFRKSGLEDKLQECETYWDVRKKEKEEFKAKWKIGKTIPRTTAE